MSRSDGVGRLDPFVSRISRPQVDFAEPIAALHVLFATVGQCSARTQRICRCRCRDNLKESNMNRFAYRHICGRFTWYVPGSRC